MEDKDYLKGFDEYLKVHPDFDAEAAEKFRPVTEELDEELFRFIMSYIVL
ncbi:MAG: hypothetical protein LBD12_01075 [Clostridiales Family XIII bacterium]|jgi:hypothetical protein|nr:hypothetical protein [Clostridiales Family XIII bacterium]